MIGPPPEGCLKGAGCVGDMQTAALAQENEKLKAHLARDQELGGTVRDYLARLQSETGVNTVLCQMVFGDMRFEHAAHSIRLFGRDVIPAFA